MGLWVWRSFDQELFKEFQTDLKSQCAVLLEVARPAFDDQSAPLWQRRVSELKEATVRITLVAADGRVLADSRARPKHMENHLSRPELQLALAGHEDAFDTRVSASTGVELLYFARVVRRKTSSKDNPGPVLGYVRVAMSLERIDSARQKALGIVAFSTLIATIFALALAVVFLRWVIGPMARMTEEADAIARGEVGRLQPSSDDELGTLARAFNRMSDRLQRRIRINYERRTELLAVLDGMIEGVIAVSKDGTVVHMNDVAGRLCKCNASQSVGKKLWECVRIPEILDTVTLGLKRNEKRTKELVLPVANSNMFIEMVSAPLEQMKGMESVEGPAGMVLVLYNVTRLRQLEALRREFIANVSHELKTPLTAIRGFIETMQCDPEMPPSIRQRFLGKAQKQTTRLSTLVSDLLTISRIESGERKTSQAQSIDLTRPIKQTILRIRPVAEEKGLDLKVQIDPGPLPVYGDDEDMQQLVGNLLSNAVTYTPRDGRVELRVIKRGPNLVIEVEDNGPGIEESHQKRIFERFYRVDKARSRELGGTGLGLSIVKNIALSLNGEVSVESVLGQGSTFRVQLPMAPEKPGRAVVKN